MAQSEDPLRPDRDPTISAIGSGSDGEDGEERGRSRTAQSTNRRGHYEHNHQNEHGRSAFKEAKEKRDAEEEQAGSERATLTADIIYLVLHHLYQSLVPGRTPDPLLAVVEDEDTSTPMPIITSPSGRSRYHSPSPTRSRSSPYFHGSSSMARSASYSPSRLSISSYNYQFQMDPTSPTSPPGSALHLPSPQNAVLQDLPEDQLRSTLLSLCLVNKTWAAEARKYLWRLVEVAVPRAWETVVEHVGQKGQVDDLISSQRRLSAAQDPIRRLATPPQSPQGSPHRRRSLLLPELEKGAKIGRGVSAHSSTSTPPLEPAAALPESSGDYEPGTERNPGLWIRHLSFSRFRTTGMRRSIREGSQSRFVTSARLLAVLRGTRSQPSLGITDEEDEEAADYGFESSQERERGRVAALGFTEYMDSSITLDVLEEILLRGGYFPGDAPTNTLMGSRVAIHSTPLQAFDLCGCVSPRFSEALDEFNAKYNLGNNERSSRFPHLHRLGLSFVSVPSTTLALFVSAFTSLTHLDLMGTRSSPALLQVLQRAGVEHGMRLRSLSLSRCRGLTSESIKELLVGRTITDAEGEVVLDPSVDEVERMSSTSVTSQLVELNLYGDKSAPSPLNRADIKCILREAPCLLSGRMEYLDIGAAPFDDELLSFFSPQPSLIEFGISNCRFVSLEGLARFLGEKAPSVEILDMAGSCVSTGTGSNAAGVSVPGRPGVLRLKTVLLHQSLIGRVASLPAVSLVEPAAEQPQRPTNLRVLELDEFTLDAIQGGADGWKVIWGKGQRGWYVQTTVASEWADPATGRSRKLVNLRADDSRRRALEKLEFNGTNNPGHVGWHSRKMEVLWGNGMLGRNDGLYGFHSYQH